MLVKNYYSIINSAFSGSQRVVKEIESGKDEKPNGFIAVNDSSILLRYGSGDTAASVDDYKLNEEIGTVKGTIVQTENSTSVIGVIANTGSESIMIKELGISVNIKVLSSSYTVLFSRTVLDAPIELLPGDIISINTQFA